METNMTEVERFERLKALRREAEESLIDKRARVQSLQEQRDGLNAKLKEMGVESGKDIPKEIESLSAILEERLASAEAVLLKFKEETANV